MVKPKTPLAPMPLRLAQLHGKLLIAAALGVSVILLLLPFDLRLPTMLLIGWDVGVALYLWLTRAMMRRADVAHIRRRSAQQDEGAFAILMLTMVAALASLVAVVFELGGVKQAPYRDAALLVLLAMVTILLSWSFVHTMFSLHYAHEYYGTRSGRKNGGLKFPGDGEPDYGDFLYFALVIAMTSQVSDVAVTSKTIRRIVNLHGVLSFFFNVSVLALTVNMVSNLINPG